MDARPGYGTQLRYIDRAKAAKATRQYHLRKKYGISHDDYMDMVEAQEGKCAICGAEVFLMVDHDHETGKVRALLCRACNTTLGWFELYSKFEDKFKAYVAHYRP
jgi:hypothetical protein